MNERCTIVVLGDIHGAHRGVTRIVSHLRACPPDLVVLVGDLGSDLLWHPHGGPPERVRRWQLSIDWVLEALEPLRSQVILVPGNHDRPDPQTRGRAVNVDGKVLGFFGGTFAGIGGAGPAAFGLPYEWSEEQLRAKVDSWAAELGELDVLVCHAPPRDTGLDRLWNGELAGSEVLRELIRCVEPSLYLCGHIHEAVGHCMLGSTLAINAGRLIWGRYNRFGRLEKGHPTAYQYHWIELLKGVPERFERVRLTCTGRLEVLEHSQWIAVDGFATRRDPVTRHRLQPEGVGRDASSLAS